VTSHAKGGSFESGMFRVRGLPRGGPVRQRFERHLKTWPLPRLSAALATILDAEIECKRTGLPDEAIARRLCLRLAQFAKASRDPRAKR
jgi:DNA polymerase-3 subunit delta